MVAQPDGSNNPPTCFTYAPWWTERREPATVCLQGYDAADKIAYVIRTGIKVYVEPQNAEKVGDIDDVVLTTMPKSATDTARVPALGITFRNSGKAHLKPKGAVEVRDENNNIVAKLDIGEFPVAPTDVRKLLLALPALKNGRYVALALLDYGGGEIAAGQYEFEVR